jgi:tetratricopeptide (TPR) repeat protein
VWTVVAFSPRLDARSAAEAFRQAVQCHRQGRITQAAELCAAVLAVMPRHGEALHLLGILRFEQRRPAEAAELLARAVRIRPDAAAFAHHGLVMQELGRHAEALASYDNALRLKPDFLDALGNRASALIELGRFEEAVADCGRALALRPDQFEAYYNRGIAMAQLGRHDEALASFDQALVLRPDHVPALQRRGIALDDLRRHAEAVVAFDRIIALQPHDAEAHNHRGIALEELRRWDEALASYERALQLKPNHVEALNNRASALTEMGRFDQALQSYAQALVLRPDYAPCHWNRSLVLLRLGSFTQGFEEFEWRRKKESWASRNLAGPEWAGEPLAGKRLLLYAEAGLGDTIQFARFACTVAKGAANVTVEVQAPLRGLLQSLHGVTVIGAGDARPAFDYHLPLMSVPHVLGTVPNTIPAPVPYLAADPDRVQHWSRRLGSDGLKIGIAWQGNPNPNIDKGRSIPLSAFAPLVQVPGVRLISLQKGFDRLPDMPAGMTVETLGPDFDAGPDAFLDSAAVMMNLDLVISSDTSLAHLAGALGRPVWIALKHVPDWRWMMDRADTPWYPTARLFRQVRCDDWDELLGRIAAELRRVAQPSA